MKKLSVLRRNLQSLNWVMTRLHPWQTVWILKNSKNSFQDIAISVVCPVYCVFCNCRWKSQALRMQWKYRSPNTDRLCMHCSYSLPWLTYADFLEGSPKQQLSHAWRWVQYTSLSFWAHLDKPHHCTNWLFISTTECGIPNAGESFFVPKGWRQYLSFCCMGAYVKQKLVMATSLRTLYEMSMQLSVSASIL